MPGSPARELSRLVQLQRDKLQALESRLLGCEAEMQDWDDSAGEADQVSQTAKLPARLPAFHQSVVFFLKVSPSIICEGGNLEEEALLLEQLVRRNDKEMEEEEFWQNELLIEQESEQQLRVRLAELQSCVRDCEAKLEQYLARIEVGVASASALARFCSLASVHHQTLVPRCRGWRQGWSRSSCSRRLSSSRRSTRWRYKRVGRGDQHLSALNKQLSELY